MSEDWAAVAKAINERVNELGWRQRELAERSQVSQAIVREIQRNTVERKRSERTLEALSVALGWHPQHLTAVLHGRIPPAVGEPREDMDDAVSARLAVIERRLTDLTEQLAELRADVAVLIRRGGGPAA
ncbi:MULTISPECIES: helix-turn-helix domain-containing protein [Amycolatopsis]|uniref:Transcriptional regulator with XRE-family HTH domain n=1 Tax=Amycolatopsis magusensis TaxID=882444 RepID=A0ABS4PS42_9PSEU|nr:MULTISPECIES: XRE family transcriptional regulator [Amycolatopsis]MBP2182245.1 transcriptional regulator with XRE-family HTH domain [Amycolatopsis magusensis]